ncbi:PKD domain-containing protein [Chloroflexota bacterium]
MKYGHMHHWLAFSITTLLLFTLCSIAPALAQDGPNGSVSGSVWEEDGQTPIEGAEVMTYILGQVIPKQMGQVFTDEAGTYVIEGLPNGIYLVSAWAAGHEREFYYNTNNWLDSQPLPVASGVITPDVDFMLSTGGTLSGTVSSAETGMPLAEVSVVAAFADGSLAGSGGITDQDGNYTITGLPYGSYRVMSPNPFRFGSGDDSYLIEFWQEVWDWDYATVVMVEEGLNPTGVAFTLEIAGSISGQIYEFDGVTPIPDVHMSAINYDTGITVGLADSGQDGRYTIGGLCSGSYRVYAWATGYLSEFHDGVTKWNEASIIHVSSATDTGGIVFTMEAEENLNSPPVANANGPYVFGEGSPGNFNAYGSSDPDGDPLKYRWDFDDDGVWDTGWSVYPSASYTWADEWSGSARVEVSDGEFADIDTCLVTVDNLPPVVEAGSNVIGECCIDEIAFSGSYTDPGTLDSHTIEWDFGDGNTNTDTLTPTHMYNAVGDYHATLSVTDNDGGVGTDYLAVSIVDTNPPKVSITSPLDGEFYLDTDDNITVEYVAEDICDPELDVVISLDGEPLAGGTIDLGDISSGEHTLVVTARDDSGNEGEDSVSFSVMPIEFKNFAAKFFTILWESDNGNPGGQYEWNKYKRGDKFSISGRLQMPEGYSAADIEGDVKLTIAIAADSGEDTIVMDKGQQGWMSAKWRYNGDENQFGEGMVITRMTIWVAPQNSRWEGWAGFYIEGRLDFEDGDGNDTRPAQATITVEMPMTAEAGGWSFIGRETADFNTSRLLKNIWYYSGWHPPFPYDCLD